MRAEEAVDREQRVDSVPQVPDIRAALRDGQFTEATFPPVVNVGGTDHVHSSREHMRPRHELNIFPEHPLGKGKLVRVPERLTEQLIKHRNVVE